MEGDDLCCPAWSPDGSRLALARDGDIIVVTTGGRGVRLLTGAGGNARPSWSPDGRWIVFDSDRGGQEDIYVVASRGGPVKRLTRGDGPNWGPDWSPDGKLIAFSRGDLQPMTAVLYVMAANGSGLRRVPLPVPAVLPDWQPLK
jgi:TolB protein